MKSNAVAIGLIVVILVGIGGLIKKRYIKPNQLSVVRIQKAGDLNPNGKDIVHLKDGTVLEEIGYQLKSLDSLSDDSTYAALIFKGKDCQDCNRDEKIYIHSTSDSQNTSLELPGKILAALREGETEPEMINQTRYFYGKCLEDFESVFFIYHLQKNGQEFSDAGKIMGFNSSHNFTTLREETNPVQIQTFLKQAISKCKEIPGNEVQLQPQAD